MNGAASGLTTRIAGTVLMLETVVSAALFLIGIPVLFFGYMATGSGAPDVRGDFVVGLLIWLSWPVCVTAGWWLLIRRNRPVLALLTVAWPIVSQAYIVLWL